MLAANACHVHGSNKIRIQYQKFELYDMAALHYNFELPILPVENIYFIS